MILFVTIQGLHPKRLGILFEFFGSYKNPIFTQSITDMELNICLHGFLHTLFVLSLSFLTRLSLQTYSNLITNIINLITNITNQITNIRINSWLVKIDLCYSIS